MASLLKNTANQFITFCLVSSTSTSGFSASTTTNTSTSAGGMILKIKASVAGAATVAAGTLTNIAGAQWAYGPTQTETNRGAFGLYITPVSPGSAGSFVPIDIQLYTDIGVPTVSSSGALTVKTNNDKTGYSLSQSFPSNFSALAITTTTSTSAHLGALTVGTMADKASYTLAGVVFPTDFSTMTISTANGGVSIAQSFPSNFGSLAIDGSGDITVGTMTPKSGYSLAQTFPTNFTASWIDGSGNVTAGSVLDKTGYSLTQAFPANFGSMIVNGAAGRVAVNSNLVQAKAQTGPLPFTMTQGGSPTTGLHVVGQRMLDGATFSNIDNAITEIGHGLYSVTLSSNDLNSQGVMLRFTSTTTNASTAVIDDRDIWINPLQ